MKSPETIKIKKWRIRKILASSLVSVTAVILLLIMVFWLSPYPSVLLIRYAFNKEAIKVNEALQKHAPTDIASIENQQYKSDDKDAFLDVYFPESATKSDSLLPVIIWVHGGGWISGNKQQLTNYCKILAGYGYTVVAIDYSIAPGKKYPTPVFQTNDALSYVIKNFVRFHINPNKIFVGGDSGGAHIAAQIANCVASATYAKMLKITPSITRKQLIGMILFCGPYDVHDVNMEGEFSSFLKTILWSYSGDKNFSTNKFFESASVIRYITHNFPPAFISAGNADPLAPQSYAFAKALSEKKVITDTLFFPKGHSPQLPHEYQFNLNTDDGKLALKRVVNFLRNISGSQLQH